MEPIAPELSPHCRAAPSRERVWRAGSGFPQASTAVSGQLAPDLRKRSAKARRERIHRSRSPQRYHCHHQGILDQILTAFLTNQCVLVSLYLNANLQECIFHVEPPVSSIGSPTICSNYFWSTGHFPIVNAPYTEYPATTPPPPPHTSPDTPSSHGRSHPTPLWRGLHRSMPTPTVHRKFFSLAA